MPDLLGQLACDPVAALITTSLCGVSTILRADQHGQKMPDQGDSAYKRSVLPVERAHKLCASVQPNHRSSAGRQLQGAEHLALAHAGFEPFRIHALLLLRRLAYRCTSEPSLCGLIP